MARRVEADETCGRGMWRVGGAHPPNALRNRIASSSCGEEVGSDGAARHRLTFGLLSPGAVLLLALNILTSHLRLRAPSVCVPRGATRVTFTNHRRTPAQTVDKT